MDKSSHLQQKLWHSARALNFWPRGHLREGPREHESGQLQARGLPLSLGDSSFSACAE